MAVNKFFKTYYILFFLTLFFSKAIAEPTLVRSKAVEEITGYFAAALTFNNDGTKMYTSAFLHTAREDRIYEYDLTTAYNISTATLNTSILVGEYTGTSTFLHGAMQIVFNNDGTKMFIADYHKTIIEFTLTTPYDIDTASTTYNAGQGYDTNANQKRPTSVAFNNDGTKMFITGNHKGGNPQSIHEYTLDNAFVITSGVTHVIEVQPDPQPDHVDGIVFNYDGTKMYITDSVANEIRQFELTTAFSIATLSLQGTLDLSTYGIEGGRETVFSSDGSKMFVIDQAEVVFEFNLSCRGSFLDGFCDPPTAGDEGNDITGSIESQTATAKQIAIHATTPVLNRMYWLRRHRNENKLSNQNIKFNFSNSMLASLSKVIPVSNKTNDALDKLSDNWSFWSEGSVSVGRVGDTSSSSSKKIDSKGITIGMDKKISENKMHGYALRFGNDYVDVGKSGTSLDTDSYSLSLYGTFSHDDKKFIEGIIGISTLKTDHVRKSGGSTRTGERDGAQVFGSINYLKTYKKENFNIVPNLRIDLSYTELSKYSETGASALFYNKQIIETGMISTGFTVSDIIDLNTMTLKPNGGLEVGIDFSPKSDAIYRYVSETTEYKKTIGQDSKNIRANIGFDLITENGFSLMTIYERSQSDNGHSDTLYLGFGYIPTDDIEYAMTLDNDKASLNYKRDLNGFDIRMSSNYSLMSQIPEYGATLEIVNTF